MVTPDATSARARLWRLIADPLGVLRRRLQPAAPPSPGDQIEVLRSYGRKAQAAGFDRLYLFLSFDCDTDRDIPASREVHRFLSGLGIKMTMAVPGTQLRNGANTYAALAQQGVEFMNHGYLPHAEWSGDRYVSATFYHEMSERAVEADMRTGDRTVREVIGRAPLGFRAPHFGMFQTPEQLALVHGVARKLGYRYCSTTIPSYGHTNGPASEAGGIIELPTFGSARAPTTVLDSWTYLADRRNYALDAAYEELLVETVDVMVRESLPGLLAWYVDPCHVVDQTPFQHAMEYVVHRGITSLYGRECAALVRKIEE